MSRKAFFLLLALVVASFLGQSWGQSSYTIDMVPNVQLQDFTQFVSDPDSVISHEYRSKINQCIKHIRDSLATQVAVVILPKIDAVHYATADDFATQLFRKWGIGDKKTQRGLLILFVTGAGNSSRNIVFRVGYGLEGDLPDALCKMIQTRVMIPLIKNGTRAAYGEGLLAGVKEVQSILSGSTELVDLIAAEERQAEEDWRELKNYWWLLGLVYFIIVVLVRVFVYLKLARKGYKKYYALIRLGIAPATSGCLSLLGLFFLPFGIAYLFINYFVLFPIIAQKVACPSCGVKGGFKASKSLTKELKKKSGEKAKSPSVVFVCSKCSTQIVEPVRAHSYVSGSKRRSGLGFFSSSGGSSWGDDSSGGSWGGGSTGGGGASSSF